MNKLWRFAGNSEGVFFQEPHAQHQSHGNLIPAPLLRAHASASASAPDSDSKSGRRAASCGSRISDRTVSMHLLLCVCLVAAARGRTREGGVRLLPPIQDHDP